MNFMLEEHMEILKTLDDVTDDHAHEKKKHAQQDTDDIKLTPCWTTCKYLLTDESCDFVRICLGNVFVTHAELERMLNFNGEKNNEKC